MRRIFLTQALLALPALSVAAGLGPIDRQYVDGMSVEESTGAVSLLLVVDRPLEDGLTKQAAKRKLLGYIQWLQSPKFSEQFPAATLKSKPKVTIAHPPPRTALGRSVLEQIEGYARELGFEPSTRVLSAPAPVR